MMYEDIKEQFEKVLQFSQGLPSTNVDELFNEWLEAKRDIIEAFDGKLIYEVEEPVHFHLDDKNRNRAFNEFVSHIHSTYSNNPLVDFLNANAKGFFDNVVSYPYEYKDIKIPVGMKLVKAFKYFEEDKELLELFQNQASRIIQEDRVVGKLCFSVHPLDFLSTSVNTYNWRSCHALDGEFRAGNLSYMLDKSTIVCYIKGEGEHYLPSFPSSVMWNSKKWRVLLYLSENWDMVFASKQYPFTSAGGLNTVREHLLKALKLSYFNEWENDYVAEINSHSGRQYYLSTSYIPIKGRLYEIDDVITEGEYSLQFNDLLRSSTYKEPYYMIKDVGYWWASNNDSVPKFVIGKQVPCVCCGRQRVRDPDLMVCRDCAEEYNLFNDDCDYPVCGCCGNHIYDENWVEVDGDILCASCVDSETFQCDGCCELHYTDQQHYDRKLNKYLCNECYAERN